MNDSGERMCGYWSGENVCVRHEGHEGAHHTRHWAWSLAEMFVGAALQRTFDAPQSVGSGD